MRRDRTYPTFYHDGNKDDIYYEDEEESLRDQPANQIQSKQQDMFDRQEARQEQQASFREELLTKPRIDSIKQKDTMQDNQLSKMSLRQLLKFRLNMKQSSRPQKKINILSQPKITKQSILIERLQAQPEIIRGKLICKNESVQTQTYKYDPATTIVSIHYSYDYPNSIWFTTLNNGVYEQVPYRSLYYSNPLAIAKYYEQFINIEEDNNQPNSIQLQMTEKVKKTSIDRELSSLCGNNFKCKKQDLQEFDEVFMISFNSIIQGGNKKPKRRLIAQSSEQSSQMDRQLQRPNKPPKKQTKIIEQRPRVPQNYQNIPQAIQIIIIDSKSQKKEDQNYQDSPEVMNQQQSST